MSTIDTTARSAMKLALEALEYIANETYDPWTNGAEAGRIAQTTLSKIKNKCRAIQTSDQMTCECGNVWDMNDPYPPKCTALREALAEQPAQQEPVAIHQFRSTHCSDWYDGVPDHHDGHGPYEVRTLYASPPAQQEPVAWVCYGSNNKLDIDFFEDEIADLAVGTMLYTSPPTLSLAQRQARSADTWVNATTWRGLTDEEILIMSRYDLEYAALIGEVQRKLKEKNNV